MVLVSHLVSDRSKPFSVESKAPNSPATTSGSAGSKKANAMDMAAVTRTICSGDIRGVDDAVRQSS